MMNDMIEFGEMIFCSNCKQYEGMDRDEDGMGMPYCIFCD